MEFEELRTRWNEVLDALLAADRVAWLAFFDARIAGFDGKIVTLDFSDSRKFGAAHEFSEMRNKQHQLLISTIKGILCIDIEIAEQ